MNNMHISNHWSQNIEDSNPTLTTGINTIDELIGGFKLGELICFAGVSSQGKSTILMSIIKQVCIERGVPVGYFSGLGLKQERFISPLLYSIAGLSHKSWVSGKITENQKLQLHEASVKLNNSPLYIDFISTNIDDVEANIRKLYINNGVELFFINKLQGYRVGIATGMT